MYNGNYRVQLRYKVDMKLINLLEYLNFEMVKYELYCIHYFLKGTNSTDGYNIYIDYNREQNYYDELIEIVTNDFKSVIRKKKIEKIIQN